MTIATFQSWNNGGTQVSSLVLASVDGQDAVNRFVEDSAGSFAQLHSFSNESDAILAWEEMQG